MKVRGSFNAFIKALDNAAECPRIQKTAVSKSANLPFDLRFSHR
jgi:hypothetical protein